jgi:hypothetical protein
MKMPCYSVDYLPKTYLLFSRYRAPEVLLQASAYTPSIGDYLCPWPLSFEAFVDSVSKYA